MQYQKVTLDTAYCKRYQLDQTSLILNQMIPVSTNRLLSGHTKPDWRQRVASGRDATTPLYAEEVVYESSPCQAYALYSTFPNGTVPNRELTLIYNLGSAIPPLGAHAVDSIAENRASTGFYKKLESASTLFQGGVALGELRETLRMIRNPAKALRLRVDDYLRAVKRKTARGSPAQKRKVLSQTWLEYSFGWMPLLNDLDDARNYLQRRQKQLAQTLVRVSARGEAKAVISDVAASYGGGNANLFWRNRLERESTTQFIGAIASTCSNQKLISASAMGFAPRSFVPTLWELLPWSFAIDYFSNIGDVITAWSNQRTRLAWGCATRRRLAYYKSYDAQHPWTGAGYAKIWTKQFSPGSSTIYRKTLERVSIDYVPIPSISFEIPGFGTKWLNLAALVAARRS